MRITLKLIKKSIKWVTIDTWWFLTGPIVVFCIPLIIAFSISESSIHTVYNFLILLLRFTGLGLIVYGIDKQLELFTGNGIKKLIIDWYNSRPWLSISVTASVANASAQGVNADIRIDTDFDKATNEEKIEYLLQVTDLNRKMIDKTKEDINSIKSDMRQLSKSVDNKISEVNETVSNAVLGNVKLEVFGTLLIMISFVHVFILQVFF